MAELHQPVRIQWNFTNTCNFNCEYCPDILKSGSNMLPEPATFLRAFSLIYNRFNSFELSLLGGEPTFYRGLDWALNSIQKDPNKKIIIETNGSREIAWWNKYGHLFEQVTISYHLNFLTVEHLFFVVETLRNIGTKFKIKLPITNKTWDEVINIKNILKEKYFDSEIQMIYKNFTKGNNQYHDYTEEQISFFYEDRNVKKEQIPEQIEQVRIHKLNEYHGHMCWAGIEQFVIDQWGNIYRGWCSQGGKIGNVFANEINFPTDPIMCQKYLCTNGFDLQARKSVNSWGRL